MRESKYQRRLIEDYEAQGGFALKLDPGTGTVPKGFPDLLVVLPGRRVLFVETKALEGRVSPLQRIWLDKLLALGHEATVARAPKEAV